MRQQLLQGYTTILFNSLLHFCLRMSHNAIFQQDSARPHVAKDMMSFLVEFLEADEFASGHYVAHI